MFLPVKVSWQDCCSGCWKDSCVEVRYVPEQGCFFGKKVPVPGVLDDHRYGQSSLPVLTLKVLDQNLAV